MANVVYNITVRENYRGGAMQTISDSQMLGGIIRQNRKGQSLTQLDVAAAAGVGLRFIVDLEKGKPTCEIEKTLRILQVLGIRLLADEA